MKFEQKEGGGALFENTKREKDTHPNLTGSVVVDGKKRNIAAWTKKDRNNRKYLSIQISDYTPKKQDSGGVRDMDEDLPF